MSTKNINARSARRPPKQWAFLFPVLVRLAEKIQFGSKITLREKLGLTRRYHPNAKASKNADFVGHFGFA